MKAQFNISRNTKVFSLIALLSLSTTMLFSQGILAETASKLFASLKNESEKTENTVSFASYNTNENTNDSFNLRSLIDAIIDTETYSDNKKNNDVVILKSFQVSDLNISIESDVQTENWMTESFSNDMESNITAESWMTEAIHSDFEEQINFEDWMAKPIYESALESEIVVEEWMTTTFEMNDEAEITVEDWMTKPLSESIEEEIEVENWMTTIF